MDKICTKCKVEKDISSFYPRGKIPGKYHSWCRQCCVAANKKWARENPELAREKNARHRRKYRYGLSESEYQQMVEDQNNLCFICESSTDYSLYVDHDHKTGKIRKLLCRDCNSALGLIKEDRKIMHKMIKYVEEYS